MFVVGWIVYLLIGSGREQSWNTPYDDLLVPVDIAREPRKQPRSDAFGGKKRDPGNEVSRNLKPVMADIL